MITFDQITVTCGLLGAVIGWFQARGKSKDEQLGQMSRSLFAGATVPTGLLLLASSYDQRLLTDINGHRNLSSRGRHRRTLPGVRGVHEVLLLPPPRNLHDHGV